MTTAIDSGLVRARNYDLIELAEKDQYDIYFRQLEKVFRLLHTCYNLQFTQGDREAEIVELFLRKLLYTTQVLKIKYSFNPEHFLRLDLTESGFPNHLEINALLVDLAGRNSRLKQMPAKSVLKRAILDKVLSGIENPSEEIFAMSQLVYLEMLEEDELFLPFVIGDITLENTTKTYRSYVFSWACWDFKTNRPYIHIMTLHQDIEAEPLEHKGRSYSEFLALIKSEGSRAPDVGIIAMAIDQASETIHPKILKRICLGPLYSRFLIGSVDVNEAEYCNEVLAQAIVDCGLLVDDFVLHMEDNIIMSKRQQTNKGSFFSGSRVREVFYIPEADIACYEKRSSMVHNYVLMPHSLYQYLIGENLLNSVGLLGVKVITYDQKEAIHGA